MIRSPARAGTIGALWCLHLVAAIYARRRNSWTRRDGHIVKIAARAGLKMSMKFNTRSTKRKIYKYHEQWCRDNGYKPTSPQAAGRRNQGHKPRVQASSLSLQAQGSGNPDRGGSPQASGHKQPGQKYFFYA